MRTSLFCFMLLLQCSVSKGQTGIYKTYEDYLNRNIIPMDTIVNFSRLSISSTKIYFITPDGKKHVEKAKNMWGFSFEGQLFRSTGLDIAAVMDTGKVCYYESGIAKLRSMMDHVTNSHFSMGSLIHLSKTLNSKAYESSADLCKENPEYKALCDCMQNNKAQPKLIQTGNTFLRSYSDIIIEIRKCIAAFNEH